MTLLEIQRALKATIIAAARQRFEVQLDQIASETPPKIELGDFAFPVAFDLSKRIKTASGDKKNPREIAADLATAINDLPFVSRVEIAGAGYINVFLDRSRFFRSMKPRESSAAGSSSSYESPKVCVEHTSVNPNKAAHVGHVRNAVIGDTFVRILRATGKRVEVQNYIDNTGVQVADVVIGFVYIRSMRLDDIRDLDREIASQGISFDYYCWDLYAEVGQRFQIDPELKAKRDDVLRAIEQGGNALSEIAEYVASRNVECILATMERFSIRYDLSPRESEILHLQFWQAAFERMKELGVIHFQSEGRNAGCWVMPYEEHEGSDEHESDKILVRSNGTVTYTGKDIAYQMWKLGLLGMDFYYRPFFAYADGTIVWTTTSDYKQNDPNAPKFGGCDRVYNVIDTRQSYPQQVVRHGVAAVDRERGEGASVHLSYEMVALSPSAAAELGFALSDDERKKSFVEMSGRKGLGVKADDLLSRLEANALAEVEARHTNLDYAAKQTIAHQLAVGAMRYFLLKFTRNTVIIFDFKEALSFEGETGCFCQYSGVRANSIFRKLAERGESADSAYAMLPENGKLDEFFASAAGDEIWYTLLLAARLEETLQTAAQQNEPAILAKFTFNLAKSFNLFYHHHKIIAESDDRRRAVLIAVADTVRRSLTKALDVMGIEVPEQM